MAKLVLKNLCKRYPNKRSKEQNDFAVNDFSLECNDGEFVGILGPSGCGKTTTLRMITGLEEITAGDIFIGETRVNELHPKERQIGLAFEDYALYPPLNVYDNIAFNPEKPYCYDCYSVWAEYQNPEYKESYCHRCGRYNDSTMEKPLCYSCYKKK